MCLDQAFSQVSLFTFLKNLIVFRESLCVAVSGVLAYFSAAQSRVRGRCPGPRPAGDEPRSWAQLPVGLLSVRRCLSVRLNDTLAEASAPLMLGSCFLVQLSSQENTREEAGFPLMRAYPLYVLNTVFC